MDSGARHVALRQKGHPRETQKRVHKDRSSRDWGDVTTSPGTPGAPEASKGRKGTILEPLEGPQPCATLISGVWSPGLGEDELLLL